ncbi:hypothetical protein [Pontibacter actiniarum]|uniref:Uncharacterized protein n=1 Tax=Pontibacter actiniarum TaxID=323450 RepID=A0A1X9YS87_9BACT|nr:hypothetical protein [Pontibacter actiniarum]ARS35713.1 hypothetical protein CA264_09820 [Pontibacter actiniarum]
MKKLLKINTKKKSLADLGDVAIADAESHTLSGGFKEYKPPLYDAEKHPAVRIKISQLFGGREEVV